MPQFTPIGPDALVELCARRIDGIAGVVVVAIDAAYAAHPAALARQITDRLQALGRAAATVEMTHFVRPASLRFEYGHTDEQSYRDSWFDHAALDREVIAPVRAGSPWLPRLWNPVTDRSFRDDRQPSAHDQVIVVAGPMLLGRHTFDLTARLSQNEATLRRHTPAADHWTIPVLLSDAHETRADIEVRYDHPDRPAIRVSSPDA
ncbi:hypothetical protein AAFP30_12160 [Gordonia sp. CPCC 205515]|uniref:hypothetical protein n=1 Tax=Gordonia sp. CPCC 205515 TaxID=3140791 RepID=UPI003AF336D8